MENRYELEDEVKTLNGIGYKNGLSSHNDKDDTTSVFSFAKSIGGP